MTRALVTQLLEALDESRGDVSQCLQEELPKAGYERYDRRIKTIAEQLEKHDAAIKAAREYLATEPSGERAELIARLNECLSGPATLTTREATAIKDAADMLEADAQQTVALTNMEQYRMQMAGISTAALGYWSEGDDIHPDYDTPALRDVARLYKKYDQLFKEKEARRAQQVKRVPMTEKQIDKIHADTARLAQIRTTFFIAFARAIEAHHGIQQADKPTGWDSGLSQDYCAEFGQWLASRPGARQQIKEMFEVGDEPEDLYALALKADNWGQP